MPRKIPQAAGLALLLLASSGQARAQDITVLVVALVPPIVLAPVCLTIARRLWLGRSSHTTPWILSLFAVSTIEVVLWLALAGSVVVIIGGDWGLSAIPLPIVACVGLWLLSRTWIDPSRKGARWLFLASPPLTLFLLAAGSRLVLLALEPQRFSA